MDKFDFSQNGIIHKNVIDWLLEEKNKKLNNNIVIYEIVRKIYYIALRQNLKVYFFAPKLILKLFLKP